MELFIKDALLIDGTGKPSFQSNIGIEGEKIIYIGKETFAAKRVIEAKELIVTPGFIDTHSHSDFTILADPRAEGKITQGITTEINGNCGVSPFPLSGEAFDRRITEINSLGLKPWKTIEQYIDLLKKANPSINLAFFCGHGNIRGSVIGYKNVKANRKQLSVMKNLLKKYFFYSIKGLSTGLIYPPGMFAEREELIELSKIVAKYGGLYTTHMRSEGEKLFSALEETLSIGKEAKIPVHISHIKTSGRENWWKIDSLLSIIEGAQKEGLKITCDRYPYTASSTDLDAFLPSWIVEGSREDIIKRLKNSKVRKQIKKYLKSKGESFLKSLLISDTAFHSDKKFEGKSLGELTNLENAADFIADLLIRSNLRVGAIYFGMKEENLIKILSKPYVMIGTDSSAKSSNGITAHGKPHPRGFGSFPRFLRRYVLEKNIIKIEEAIEKITALPAKIFKIEKRGLIKEGYFADLVIMDLNEIEDTATFEEPFKIAKGIKYVIVNGSVTVEDGTLSDIRKGQILL